MMNKNTLYQTLKTFTKDVDETTNEPSQNPPKVEDIWSSLYSVAVEDPAHLPIFYPLIKQYTFQVPEFADFQLPNISSSLPILSNNTNDDSTRYQAAAPLISLLPFFSFQQFCEVISAYLTFLDQVVQKELKFPKQLIDLLNKIEFSLLQNEAIDGIYDFLEEQLKTSKVPATLFIYAAFSDCFVNTDPEYAAPISKNIVDNISKDPIHKIAAFYLLEKVSEQFGILASIPSNLFPTVLPYLIDFSNEEVLYRAHKGVRAMISNKLLNNQQALKAILGQYPSYPVEKYNFFFKLLQKYLDNLEDIKLDLVQLLLDFVNETINSENSFVRGKCLEIVSQIAAIDKLYVEDIYESCFDIALRLLDTEHTCLTEVTNYFLMVDQSFPGSKVPIIHSKLPILADSLSNNEELKKSRMERAASLAAIIQNSKAFSNIVQTISSFVISSLDQVAEAELFYICSVVISLRTQLTKEAAATIFSKLASMAKHETNPPQLNAILHTMKKILTKTDFGQDESSNIALTFATSLIKGEIDYFGGMPLYTCQDEKTMIFYFIAAFIRKYPLLSSNICDVLVSCVSEVSDSIIPAILEPIEAAIHSGVYSHDVTNKLYHEIIELAKKLSVDEDEEQMVACFEILSEIGRSHPDVFDHGHEIFALIKSIIQEIDDEEEDEVGIIQDLPPFGPIIRFSLELITLKFAPIEIDQDLMKKLVECLPLSPQITTMDDIMKIIVESIVVDKVKFGFLYLPCMICLAKLLVLTDMELKEYDFDQKLVNNMKATLKRVIREDKSIERQVTMTFKNQRPKLNRFAKLLK